MAQPKIKFRFGAPRDGGHSLLKIVAFDFKGNSIPIVERYSFNGRLSPETQKPQMYEKADAVEKGIFKNSDLALKWALELWEKLDKSNVAHGYVADADYNLPGANIWRTFDLRANALKPEEKGYRYCLRVKLPTGNYLEIKTLGEIDEETGELKDNRNACFRDLQRQFANWSDRNDTAAKFEKGMIFGDGKRIYNDTKDFALFQHDFNTQTLEFSRKGRKEIIKIHDPMEVRIAQAIEEAISNA